MSTSQRVTRTMTGSSSRSILAARPSRTSVVGRRATRAQAAKADRPMWYPGAKAPKYLDGSMEGDYGFDPLRLGQNENLVKYYREAELMNGRWAMAAVAGILFTEAAGLPDFVQAATQDYGIPFNTLVITQVIVMGVLEYYRIKSFEKTGECSLLLQAPFDPLGLKSEETKVKELKNPIADPAHNNIYTSKVGFEFTVFVVALSVLPMIIEAFKVIGDDSDEEFRPIPW